MQENFRGKNILCNLFLLCLIFMGQATWLFLVALIISHKQIFICLIFMGQATHQIRLPQKFLQLRYQVNKKSNKMTHLSPHLSALSCDSST